MYRWAPDNEARATTEPAPSDLLKATGIEPSYEKRRSPPRSDLVQEPCRYKGRAVESHPRPDAVTLMTLWTCVPVSFMV
jgi:hypothetical protein